MYEFIKSQYDMGLFTAEEVQSFVPLFITQEEADSILGKQTGAKNTHPDETPASEVLYYPPGKRGIK